MLKEIFHESFENFEIASYGGRGIFEPQEFFLVIKFLVFFFFGNSMTNLYFAPPPPPAPHDKFSNGPSLSSAAIKIVIWINSAGLNNLDGP